MSATLPEADSKSPAHGTVAGAEDVLQGRDVEVFYDGDCPLCLREINMLRRKDKQDRIRFTDIAAAGFDPGQFGLDMPTMMAEIHGRLPDGRFITGVEVFRHLYTAVGFPRLVAMTRWPVVRQGLDVAYSVFAKLRPMLPGRRCKPDGECRVG